MDGEWTPPPWLVDRKAPRTRRVKPMFIVSVLIAMCVAAFYMFADYYGDIVWWFIRESMFVWLGLCGVVVLVMPFAMWAMVRQMHRRNADLPTGLAVVMFIVGFAGFLWYATSYHSYQLDQAYAKSVQVSLTQAPTFGQRAPYQVADTQARPNLGSYPGDITDTMYLPDRDTYSSLVTRRGVFAGYHVILEQHVPLIGRATQKTTCEFSQDASARVGGMFSHNLGREIAHERRWLFNDADVYGACVNGHPIVVAPMERVGGSLLVATKQFAGDAVYDGITGKVTIVTDPKEIAKLPGPTYPLSLAERQRESTQAMGSYGDYVFGRSGWETTDESGTFDINSGNTAEFVLLADGNPAYVTPLTGRGSATSISAISILRPTQTGLAPLTVYSIDPTWVSTSAIDSRIKADFQDLPNWQNLQVMEVTPLDGHQWVATIGNGQNILYRVTGPGTLIESADPNDPANQLCLHDGNNNLIRCGTVVGTNGSGPGVAIGPRLPGGQVAVPNDVSTLTDQQLSQLLREVNDEASKRLARSKPNG